MALGKRKDATQPLFVVTADLPSLRPNPFYEAVNNVLAEHDFDRYVEGLCAKFYDASNMGRPSLPPGVYVRCLLVGYFEGLDSERGIAWRCSDSRSLGLFLGYAIDEPTPDHSTISRTRRLIDLETHQEVFAHVLKILAERRLVDGKTIGVDGTTLEANAALRSIVRRDTGQGYQAFLTELAKQSGIETPTRADLAKLDRDRKNKGSNDDWQNPHDPDAKITKMKDGTTHLAHKAEHAVDMGESGHGALLAVNVCDAVAGDTKTLCDTINEASENLRTIADDERVGGRINERWASEVVTDKGYHSNDTMRDLREMDLRSYVSEPERGRRNWGGTDVGLDARDATYANRRRVRGPRGRRLMCRRGELIERSFAHAYETGAMRRLHLRRRDNIAKRVLIHAAGFNLGLLMRVRFGLLKPRRLSDASDSSGGDRGSGSSDGGGGACESIRVPLTSMWNGLQALVRRIGNLCRTLGSRPRALAASLTVQAA